MSLCSRHYISRLLYLSVVFFFSHDGANIVFAVKKC